MRILIADDHAIVRKGLVELLTRAFQGSELVEVGDGTATLQKVGEENWDVLILDLSMPGATAFEVIEKAKQLKSSLPIIVLSMHPEDQFAMRAMRAGADSYLTKETAPEELVAAVRCTLSGEKYFSAAFRKKLEEGKAASYEKATDLSEREFAVMQLLYEGNPIKEIAARLTLSPKTVSTYRQRVLDKIGLRSNAELVQYIINNKII